MDNQVDVLIFNPPYVVTDDGEIPRAGKTSVGEPSQGLLVASWAGGMNGMTVTSRFIQLIPKLISDKGRFYLVLIKENGVDGVIKTLNELNIDAWITMERKCGIEHLFVITGKKTINKNKCN